MRGTGTSPPSGPADAPARPSPRGGRGGSGRAPPAAAGDCRLPWTAEHLPGPRGRPPPPAVARSAAVRAAMRVQGAGRPRPPRPAARAVWGAATGGPFRRALSGWAPWRRTAPYGAVPRVTRRLSRRALQAVPADHPGPRAHGPRATTGGRHRRGSSGRERELPPHASSNRPSASGSVRGRAVPATSGGQPGPAATTSGRVRAPRTPTARRPGAAPVARCSSTGTATAGPGPAGRSCVPRGRAPPRGRRRRACGWPPTPGPRRR